MKIDSLYQVDTEMLVESMHQLIAATLIYCGRAPHTQNTNLPYQTKKKTKCSTTVQSS